MTLQDLDAALKALPGDVFHQEAHKKTDKYFVWAEEGQSGGTFADNKMRIQKITGTLDYFTRTEFDPVLFTVQALLNSLKVGWKLISCQKENDTGYFHYEWAWEFLQRPEGA